MRRTTVKRYVLSLFCAGLAGLAWAADPPAVAPAPCPPPCAPKVCVPEPTTRKVEKVVYDDKCVDYCLPRCSLFSLFAGKGCGCGDGGCLNCGQPRTRHVLIKRLVREECPDVKCEVREAPCVPGP